MDAAKEERQMKEAELNESRDNKQDDDQPKPQQENGLKEQLDSQKSPSPPPDSPSLPKLSDLSLSNSSTTLSRSSSISTDIETKHSSPASKEILDRLNDELNKIKNGATPRLNGGSIRRQNSTRRTSNSGSPSVDSPSRRSSVYITPPSNRIIHLSAEELKSPNGSSPGPQPFPGPSNAANAGAAASVRAFQGANNGSKQELHSRAAALAAAKKSPQSHPLTAQQRLQQHILRSQQNGTAIAKTVDSRPKNKPIYITSPTASQSPASVPAQTPRITLTNDDIGSSGSEISMSPLNSLDEKSQESQQIIKVQNALRNKTNFNKANGSQDIINSTPTKSLNAPKLSPVKLSPSPSVNRNRSRSNSNNLKPNSTVTLSPTHGLVLRNGSDSSLQTRSRSGSQASQVSLTRSRSSSVRKMTAPPMHPGNLEVAKSEEPLVDDSGEVVKKVRFFNVPEYCEDEDAPTPQQLQKQIRQKWSSYKPQFRNRTKLLNSQEGLAFRKVQHLKGSAANNGEFEGFTRNHQSSIPIESNGKFSMMSVVNGTAGGEKKISKFFKRK
ncbi:unnamed protein product [Ambrosiozyma monospora]|uniref:Unnamed protein product n=1 Tax=Ambrosiozyma monospora TaxID=43982 RepID=A0ACB5SWN2_AMBMO|nr:unnamed protein product [Ambrosiozyma monospora]